MAWLWTLLTLLLKYGPIVFDLVKGAIELIKWLRKNDHSFEPNERCDLECQLKTAVAHYKKTGDDVPIREIVGQLRERRSNVERFKRK